MGGTDIALCRAVDTTPITSNASASAAPLQITIHPEPSFWGGGNGAPSFKDALDVINPLQQLPGIGTIYRSLTGDTISSGARVAGSTLYGGPLGLLSALANEVVKTQTGSDIGENLLALAQGKSPNSTASADLSTTFSPAQLKSYTNAYLQSQSLLA